MARMLGKYLASSQAENPAAATAFSPSSVHIHNGAPEDPDSAQVPRLAIVDLPPHSEKNKNTHSDRLKEEAGNILTYRTY